jgi:hypothetical protein
MTFMTDMTRSPISYHIEESLYVCKEIEESVICVMESGESAEIPHFYDRASGKAKKQAGREDDSKSAANCTDDTSTYLLSAAPRLGFRDLCLSRISSGAAVAGHRRYSELSR